VLLCFPLAFGKIAVDSDPLPTERIVINNDLGIGGKDSRPAS
jgi:hypothetical protein